MLHGKRTAMEPRPVVLSSHRPLDFSGPNTGNAPEDEPATVLVVNVLLFVEWMDWLSGQGGTQAGYQMSVQSEPGRRVSTVQAGNETGTGRLSMMERYSVSGSGLSRGIAATLRQRWANSYIPLGMADGVAIFSYGGGGLVPAVAHVAGVS